MSSSPSASTPPVVSGWQVYITPVKDFVAGAVGGVALVLVGHPLDTLKVRLQTGGDKFNGLLDVFSQTLKKEGLGGFYKGIASPIVGVAAMNATLFFAWGSSCRWMKSTPDEVLSVPKLLCAGLITGFAVSFVEGPVDLIKSKMQIQYTGKAGAGATFRCFADILKNFGIRGIYQGLGATFLRNIPANAAYFGVYEVCRRKFSGDVKQENLSTIATLCAGGLGGVAYWTFSFPMDVNKSKIQTEPSIIEKRKYKNSLDCIQQMWKNEGMKAFWRGFTPCLIRAFPANAACFFTYEFTRKLLGQ